MRIKENKEINELLYKCFNCNGCVGRWPEEQCPFRFIHEGMPFGLRGMLQVMRRVAEGDIPLSEDLARYFYTCTLCSDCEKKCVYGLPVLEIGKAFRSDLIDAGFGPRKEHIALIQNMKNYDNPWGIPRAKKGAWAKGLDAPRLKEKKKAEVLYFVGCTAASDPVVQPMAATTVSVLNKAGVDFAVLGNEEKCCGSTSHWLGDEAAFKKQASENLEYLNSLKVKTVTTSCAGCYNMLKVVYPEVIGEEDFEVLHTVEYIARLMKKGNINFKGSYDAKVTYHDPCHLGKHAGCYDAPREILEAVPGLDFVEMERIRENSWCCGAGGGVRTAYPDNATKIAIERIKEAEATGADQIVSACPFCQQNFVNSIKACGSPIKTVDILEIVDQVIEDKREKKKDARE